jgi:hypothetical protein
MHGRLRAAFFGCMGVHACGASAIYEQFEKKRHETARLRAMARS